ncbi:unnamed protein product [Brugia pahangi]|uniref:Uncharacterized protein n=1 Tax=Brugia pahangi TaxID=6280 RepID=A0A0N4SXI4_BRUPA|nr:unnamed protein product [Brugia pahangi]
MEVIVFQTAIAIHQLCYYDRIVTSANSVQDYSLLKYLSASAVQRYEQSVEIIESMRAGAAQKNLSLSTIALEILPYLISIVQPDFKPMNVQLYSIRELNVLHSIISIMRTYSLTYTSVLHDESVSFVFKPAIEQLVMFTDDDACCSNRSSNTLSVAARQLIAHEIELEKMRNVDALASEIAANLPGKKEELIKSGKFGAGIILCYNSGSSSAIRRRIMIKNLFSS